MALPIREAVLAHRRDSYLDGMPSPALSEGEAGAPIDCVLGCGQWGVSPRAAACLRALDPAPLAAYPERHHERLLAPALLARFQAHGVSAEQLFLGHGSFGILERLVHKLLKPGCTLGVGPQFTELPSEVRAAGGSYCPLPLASPRRDLPLADIEAALAAGGASLVYIDNPNNPLGCHFPPSEIARLAASCARASAVLVVDEALGDFLEDEHSCIRLAASHDNVIVTRSFSKAFGLAAERIGYAFFSPALARHYREVDAPFEPGLLGATLARETLADGDFLEHVRREARWAKSEIVSALREAGIEVLPTHPAVSILTAHAPGRALPRELLSVGVLTQAGSSFARTHEAWDDSYCRLRVPGRPLVAELCNRIRSIA